MSIRGWIHEATKSNEKLVDREKIEEFLERDSLKKYSPEIKERWLGMLMWWDGRSAESRRRYFLYRWVVVVGGVTLPVLSALNVNTRFQNLAPNVIPMVVPAAMAIVSAIVAGCAAWEGIANYGEIWREKRRAAELLKVEGWQFFQNCGKYELRNQTQDEAFHRFALEVESMIAKEVGEYLGTFGPSMDQARADAMKLLNDNLERVRKLLEKS